MEKDENSKKEIKKVKIISLIIICILCLIILILLLFYKKDYHKNKEEQTTTTGEQVSSTTPAIQNNNLHKNSLLKNDTYESDENKYSEIYSFENIQNYKTTSSVNFNSKLELYDKKYSVSFNNLDHIDDNTLKISDGNVYYQNKVICKFEDAKYISYRKRDEVDTGIIISFYGYYINNDKTDIYECNISEIESSNKLIFTYETNEFYDFLYVYQDDIYIKNKKDNIYNIYDHAKVADNGDIFKIYEDIMFYTNGDLYYNTSELIGNYDFRKIIYINSGCDAPSSMIIVSSDNRLVSSMHGSDYKKFDKKFTDIYVNDISNRVVTVEFEDGTTENLDFGGC